MVMLRPNLKGVDDKEGENVPEGLPIVVDAHVHIFPATYFLQSGHGLTKMPGLFDIG